MFWASTLPKEGLTMTQDVMLQTLLPSKNRQEARANWLTSERLGRVTVPSTQKLVHEPAFTREEAHGLLASLAQNLGLHVLGTQVKGGVEVEAEVDADSEVETDAVAEVETEAVPGFEPGDEAIRQAFAALDMVWMDGGNPVAAFAFEPGDRAWSGPRRCADLVALHPKVKTAFYVVLMPSAHAEMLEELHRPAFHLLKRPLHEVTRLLHWPRLCTEITQIGNRARYLKPEFLSELSEGAA
jgi:hypothetical protein